jgi:CheY-like chemotaxis protein
MTSEKCRRWAHPLRIVSVRPLGFMARWCWLLDLMLPGISGFDVARILRNDERTRNAAIVAVTALASQRHHLMALNAGCDACLSKPVLGAMISAELMILLVKRRAAVDMSRLNRP